MRTVPDAVREPVYAGLWKPIMWAYCEGAPIGVALLIALPGPLVIRTALAAVVALAFFVGAWSVLQRLAAWDPRAWRVFRRARRYRSAQTGMLPARATWGSPPVRLGGRRRH